MVCFCWFWIYCIFVDVCECSLVNECILYVLAFSVLICVPFHGFLLIKPEVGSTQQQHKSALTACTTHTLWMFTCNVGYSERLLALCPFGAVGVTLFGSPRCWADASQVHLCGFEEGHHEGLFILRPTATNKPCHTRIDTLSCRGRQRKR